MLRSTTLAGTAGLLMTAAVAAPQGSSGFESMTKGVGPWRATAVFTIGETLNGYTPPGILDGAGAYELDGSTVRVLVNHELLNGRGYAYDVEDGMGGTFSLLGARLSYFDIDKSTLEVVDTGLAYDRIYDANGNQASDITFLAAPEVPAFGVPSTQFQGFSRFCSAGLFEAEQFGEGRGLTARAYFCGEEDGGGFNSVSGAVWMLDPATDNLWQVPALGRGAWENLTVVDTGATDTVAIILADDSSPFDADAPYTLPAGTGDADREAAPLYLYVGTKNPNGDFVAQQGLRDGQLHVWVPDDQNRRTPAEFNTSGTLTGSWVAIDNSPNPALASDDGTTGYDEYGFPTQRLLWLRAEAVGAFGFSRPEDLATNPFNGSEIAFVSTGVDTYVNGADTFGTIYTIDTDFQTLEGDVTIMYDGDADPNRGLRSVDNIDWADDGFIYGQEDEAEEDTLTGEPLFGPGAVNPNEAGIVRVDPTNGDLVRIANIDRDVVLDASIADPTLAVDVDAGEAGEWETSGITDVSSLFGRPLGTLFLFDVQAHGIEDQDAVNPSSRINDGDLVEGGQLSFLEFIGLGDDYCVATTNSTGEAAHLTVQGSREVADNDVTLVADNVPAQQFGVFVFGETQTVLGVGNGFLCVGNPVRADVVLSSVEGSATLAFDLTSGPAAGIVLPGTTQNFQFWFRDGMSASNLTQAVSVDFN